MGGDFYDWQQPNPDYLNLTLADVMGKGMPAALLMATVRAALRTVAPRSWPAAALELAGLALAADLDRSDSFVTLSHARLDATARRLSYVDAGHGHVFVRRADGPVELLSPRGLPLGVMPNLAYQEGAVQLAPGDALILYSDGLVEASPAGVLDRDALAAQFGGAASAAELVARLCTLADAGGTRPDDLTVIVLLAT